jgi:hypothetical protein
LRIVRLLPPFILLSFALGAGSAHGDEHSTRLPIGTLQTTGRGAAPPAIPGARPFIEPVRRDAQATRTHIPIGTLQMTGRGQASPP